MSIRLQPSCCRWMRSLFAKTVHRVATVGGFGLWAKPLASSYEMPRRPACSSRNEPVPAAQSEFVE